MQFPSLRRSALQAPDALEARQILLSVSLAGEPLPTNRFIYSDEYFPVTRRQMKQGWRYLRRRVREGPAIELDIDATVAEFARRGMLLAPVLVPRRVNRARLALLIDTGGSMVPFGGLAHSLTETALRGGRLGQASVFYFHNVPAEYIYHDAAYRVAEEFEGAMTRLGHERAAVLVFSDAGAARGTASPERIAQTQRCMAVVRQHIRHVAWLNPMPRDRWARTSAGAIAEMAPMLEFTRRGLYTAIDVLRGRTKELPHSGGFAQ